MIHAMNVYNEIEHSLKKLQEKLPSYNDMSFCLPTPTGYKWYFHTSIDKAYLDCLKEWKEYWDKEGNKND